MKKILLLFVALATVSGIRAEDLNLTNADCVLDENINISGVTALILKWLCFCSA
jgi:hypothetical protein